MRCVSVLSMALVLAALTACSKTAPPDPKLVLGKTVWEGTCRTCHLNGIGGAPAMGNLKAWTPRIAQGFDVLVAHALNGFSGNEGNMPPRGGNAALTDAEVDAAVYYMVANSQ